MRIRHIVAIVAGPALALGVAVAVPAQAAPATTWHVGVYNPSGRALSQGAAAGTADGLASLRFTTTPDTALLVTRQGSQKGNLLGDITGATVSATFTITGSGTVFTYYGERDACGAAASARLFFQTSTPGNFAETDYWWSNPSSIPLAAGTFTITATVAGGGWSDYNGHFGTDAYASGFAAAAAHVTAIGLSFGGGCFFENGVGAPDASLTLTAFTVT
ncbi:MAG: hypothetical protein EPN43_14610 [Jatrophihabitans sp.]|nr:MAG: hypothetical protein EPN43_14610 [Jatrophihabitans sp.]